MLEMKNSLISDQDNKQLDFFTAIQKLSLFVINRTGDNSDYVDEGSRNVVRGIFNENVCKLLEQYETKLEQQRRQIYEASRE